MNESGKERGKERKTQDCLACFQGPILGSMRAKDDELARLLSEWETDFKVDTTKAAIDDIDDL
jgi:hypothetical protein